MPDSQTHLHVGKQGTCAHRACKLWGGRVAAMTHNAVAIMAGQNDGGGGGVVMKAMDLPDLRMQHVRHVCVLTRHDVCNHVHHAAAAAACTAAMQCLVSRSGASVPYEPGRFSAVIRTHCFVVGTCLGSQGSRRLSNVYKRLHRLASSSYG